MGPNKAKRGAIIYAETLALCCPHCGELVDEPISGSQAWTPEDLRRESAESPNRACSSCGEAFVVRNQNRATIDAVRQEQS